MMKIKEKIMKEVEHAIDTKCDFCGQLESEKKKPFYSFHSNRNDWGNDNIDSYEYYDVCSPDCYFGQLEKLVKVEFEDEMDHSIDIDEKGLGFIKGILKFLKKTK